MKKLVLILVGTIFVAGCANLFQRNTTKDLSVGSYASVSTKLCSFDNFDSIVISGDTNAELINGYNTLEVVGVNGGQYNCQKGLYKKTLKIGSENNQAEVKIGARNLKNITVMNNAVVRAKDFNADDLTITAKDSGSINLQGKLAIKQIFQMGNGMINVSWVNSNKIRVNAEGGGPIHLAGITNSLFAKLLNKSQLNARYLRTKDAQVFTTDEALAEVLVLNRLDGFAVDSSDIYYYKRPQKLTVVTRDHANVLRPEWSR